MVASIKPSPCAWINLPAGDLLLGDINALLNEQLKLMFGFHLINLGELAGGIDLSSSPVRCRWALQSAGGAISAEPENLPIKTDSVDVVLMPLTLDFCSSPHDAVREAHRVLIGDGQVVIVGLNPWSLWRMRAVFSRTQLPWSARFLRPARLKDWLHLLGFEVQYERFLAYRPPVRSASWWTRLSGWERWACRSQAPLGAIYIVIAKKRVLPLTPLRVQKRSVLPISLVGVAQSVPRRDAGIK